MLDFEFRSHCPISSALDIFGDKWSLVIIRDLFIGINTYSDFLKSPEKISTNILVDRIKKLRKAHANINAPNTILNLFAHI